MESSSGGDQLSDPDEVRELSSISCASLDEKSSQVKSSISFLLSGYVAHSIDFRLVVYCFGNELT